MYPAFQSTLNVLEISIAILTKLFCSCLSLCWAKHQKFAQLSSSKGASRFELLYFMPWSHSSFLAAGISGNGGSVCLLRHWVSFIPSSELHLTFQYPKFSICDTLCWFPLLSKASGRVQCSCPKEKKYFKGLRILKSAERRHKTKEIILNNSAIWIFCRRYIYTVQSYDKEK